MLKSNINIKYKRNGEIIFMANRKKEIKAIRVNQKTREVIVYAKSIDNEQQ